MDFVEIAGVRYVRATDIARHFGYTADYVGQLSRAGKIDAKQIGRVWYIREGQLDAHKKDNVRSNKKKTQVILRKTLQEDEIVPGKIYNTMYVPPPGNSEFRKRLLDTSIRYESDEHPLSPKVSVPPVVDQTPSHVELPYAPLTQQAAPIVITEEPPVVEDIKEEHHRIAINKSEEDEEFLEAQRLPEPALRGRISVSDLDEFSEEEKAPPMHVSEKRTPKALSQPRPSDVRGGHTVSTFLTPVSVLSPIPVIALAKPKPLSLRSPFVTALVPLMLLIALAFSFSSIFLHRVLVYRQNPSSSTGPYFSASLGVNELSNVISSLSR